MRNLFIFLFFIHTSCFSQKNKKLDFIPEYSLVVESSENISIDFFRKNNKTLFSSKKINDKNFGSEKFQNKKNLLICKEKRNKSFTSKDVESFILKNGGRKISLPEIIENFNEISGLNNIIFFPENDFLLNGYSQAISIENRTFSFVKKEEVFQNYYFIFVFDLNDELKNEIVQTYPNSE